MNVRLSITLLFGFLAAHALSQGTITGKVVAERTNEALPAANVYWAGTTMGAITNEGGAFTIAAPPDWPARLVASFVGYAPDTLLLQALPAGPLNFTLRWAVEMGPVEVVERVQGTQLSTRTINATEVITQKELKRAACCDLSESFETNATVDVSFSDAVSGTKTIRMLGLDGKYAQISVENIPFIRGLSTASGLTLLPGTWIKDINLSKGIGTAVNGPNAMTGQIDLCLVNPLSEPPLFVNLYGNSQGRMEANVHTAQATGKQSANLLLVHGNWMGTELDQNADGFMDMPMTRRINVMDRWLFQSERRSSQVALRFVDDAREGGQLTGHAPAAGEHAGHRPDMPYDIDIRNRMVDVMAKHGTIFENDPTKSIGFIVSGRRHSSKNTYGIRQYDGLQQSFYANAVFQQLLGKGTDQLKTGLAFQFDDYRELFTDTIGRQQDLGRVERMPGVFAEYTRMRNGFTLVAGLRADANDRFGSVVSPRVHAKFDLGPLTTARFSVGRGFRTANPLVESGAVMASSRRVIFEDDLGMERSWNLGASLLHKFKWLDRKWAVGVDAYHTSFTSQVVADLDRAPTVLAFYMLNGPSYANSALLDIQLELSKMLDLKMSYRFYDVRTTFRGPDGDRLLERPFIPQHRGMIDLAFADRKEHWRFDIGLNLFGASRIPFTQTNPVDYRMSERAPAYATLHAQITRVVGPWEFYLGGENLTSTLQQQQILAADNPFGPYFDASLIWGPINKAMLYGGLRFTLKPSKNGPKK